MATETATAVDATGERAGPYDGWVDALRSLARLMADDAASRPRPHRYRGLAVVADALDELADELEVRGDAAAVVVEFEANFEGNGDTLAPGDRRWQLLVNDAMDTGYANFVEVVGRSLEARCRGLGYSESFGRALVALARAERANWGGNEYVLTVRPAAGAAAEFAEGLLAGC